MTDQTQEEFKKNSKWVCVHAVSIGLLGAVAGASATFFVSTPSLAGFIGVCAPTIAAFGTLRQIKKSLNMT